MLCKDHGTSIVEPMMFLIREVCQMTGGLEGESFIGFRVTSSIGSAKPKDVMALQLETKHLCAVKGYADCRLRFISSRLSKSRVMIPWVGRPWSASRSPGYQLPSLKASVARTVYPMLLMGMPSAMFKHTSQETHVSLVPPRTGICSKSKTWGGGGGRCSGSLAIETNSSRPARVYTCMSYLP